MCDSTRGLAALLIFVVAFGASASAEEVTIDSKDYAKLSAAQQAKLTTELKKNGLLAEGDSVKNAAKPDTAENPSAALLTTLIPGLCKLIVDQKKQDELAKCAKKKAPQAAAPSTTAPAGKPAAKEADAKPAKGQTAEQCKAAVDSKYGSVDAVCGAIKLF